MFAKEIRPAYESGCPVAVSAYKARRQIPHYHKNTIEMILCLKGCAEVYSMHKKHVLKPGDIVETDMFDIHSVSSDEDNLMISFHFDLEHPLFEGKGYDLRYYVCNSDEADVKTMYHINRIRMLLMALLTSCMRDSSSESVLAISEKIIDIIQDHFQYYNHINQDDELYPAEMRIRFQQIMSYMLEHYPERVTMADICEEVHISYSYLSRFFKDSSLKTFRNFLHEIRVDHSEHLLLCRPELSVPDIGYRVGFSDPKFFYREFRRKHGHTPHQHRMWYRTYNKTTAPDELLSLSDNREMLLNCIVEGYTNIVCSTEL